MNFSCRSYVFSFWFVDLITIKLVLDSRWITLGFYWKYVSEINITRPLLNSTWRNLMEMYLVFQYNLVWKILLIAIVSKSVINKSESIKIALEKEWSLSGGSECSGFTWGVWWKTYLSFVPLTFMNEDNISLVRTDGVPKQPFVCARCNQFYKYKRFYHKHVESWVSR